MKRFWVLRDGTIIGAAPNRKEAIEMIRQHQQRETHYLLKASFSIMYAEEEFVPYQDKGKKRKARDEALQEAADEGSLWAI